LPPFISFSTSYPELPPMPNCMARRLFFYLIHTAKYQ